MCVFKYKFIQQAMQSNPLCLLFIDIRARNDKKGEGLREREWEMPNGVVNEEAQSQEAVSSHHSQLSDMSESGIQREGDTERDRRGWEEGARSQRGSIT